MLSFGHVEGIPMNQQQMNETVCRRIFPHRKENYDCKQERCNLYPRVHGKCRIIEKSAQQLEYVISTIRDNIFLKACPGSGKTEVVGLKAAYEFHAWKQKYNGIAILTFTNNAADVIRERVQQFAGIEKSGYPHFIGTIDSWLHGYLAHPFGHLITGYQGKDGDKSIRVVEDNVSEGWINYYKCATGYTTNSGGVMPLYANNLRFDVERNGWEIKIPNSSEYLPDEQYFESAAFRNFRSDKSWLTLKSMRQKFSDVKDKFFRDGFATYHDIEWICYRLLEEKKDITKRLSQRFPFIIIDECQDLSWIQLEILYHLKQCGTILHFVGDLNQAIYEFKKVDPQQVEDFVSKHGFKCSELTDNFRSCQPIVDLCQKLVNGGVVVGKGALPKFKHCIYFQYKEEQIAALPNRFEAHLARVGIGIKESAILARGWSTVYKLQSLDKGQIDKPQIKLALAIYLWSKQDIKYRDEALKHLGSFISNKYFKDKHSNSRQYYCPEILRSPMRWRLFLSRILDGCLESNCVVNNLDQIWENWAVCVRCNFSQIAASCICMLQSDLSDSELSFKPLDGRMFQALKGYKDKKVIDTLVVRNEQASHIKITTIHKVKGKTFDAILLVSSPDKRGGKGGHWKEWLTNAQDEHARFAYVASSRPKKLLAWAIPDGADLTKMQELGFHII